MRDEMLIDWTNLRKELRNLTIHPADKTGHLVVANDFHTLEVKTRERRVAVKAFLKMWKDKEKRQRERLLDSEMARRKLTFLLNSSFDTPTDSALKIFYQE